MNLARAFPCFLVLSGLLAAPAVLAAAPPSGVVLNEFVAGPATDWNGSGAFSSRDDEWVELHNADAADADLSEYFITDGDSIPRCGLSGFLAGGGYVVVYGSDAYAWERDHGFPAFGLSLGNSGDAVLLWRVTGGDTTLVDAYGYASHEAAADRAVGRLLDGDTWTLFDGLNPYTGSATPAGNGCAPTPGAFNACGVTSAAHSTWGRLKTLYRGR